MEVAAIFAIGLTAGIISGLLGIGGGAVLVPLLVFFLALPQHLAQGISMVYIIPTSIAALIQLHRNKQVDYTISLYLAAGAIVGALLTSNIVQYIPGDELKKIFGVFVIFTGARMILAKPKK